MNEPVAFRSVRVPNPQGVHARPCFQIVQAAIRYRSHIVIENVVDGNSADAKSMVDMLTLNAPCGTELRIIARGDDANEAVGSLEAVIISGFGEMASDLEVQ